MEPTAITISKLTPNLRPRRVSEHPTSELGGAHRTRHSDKLGPSYRTSVTAGARSGDVGSRSSVICTPAKPSTSVREAFRRSESNARNFSPQPSMV
eukprot:scaffold170405_cov34-Tisochrysis_lutea.AAC.2